MRSVICPNCGCSLVRLGISREAATHHEHEGRELHFCCQGCLSRFIADPDHHLDRSRHIVVCPACLGEKPVEVAVRVEAFDRDPEGLTGQLVNW